MKKEIKEPICCSLFENEFAHGAFQANAQYIDEHFDILRGVFEDLTDLYQTPIVYFRNEEIRDTNHQRVEIDFPIEQYEIDQRYAYPFCRKEQSLISLCKHQKDTTKN